MRRVAGWVCVVFVVVMSVAALAQKTTLADADKEAAIRRGLALKGKETGLYLTDQGAQWMAALSSTGGNLGFRLRLYTPTTWIEQQASNASKEYKPFTLADITEEMTAPVLRVVVFPDVPSNLTATAMRGTSSVQHVILQDGDRKKVLQPLSKEEFEIPITNAKGQGLVWKGVRAVFNLAQLDDMRGGPNKEFHVVVVGTDSGKERVFKVKTKHLPDLK